MFVDEFQLRFSYYLQVLVYIRGFTNIFLSLETKIFSISFTQKFHMTNKNPYFLNAKNEN